MSPKAQNDAGSRQQTLGEFLRNLRDARGLKLRQVEEVADVSNAYLSQLEHGKITKPSPHILHSLAEVYRVPYETLMEKAGYITRSADTQKGKGNRVARLATFADETLTPQEEEELLKYLAFLRSRKPNP